MLKTDRYVLKHKAFKELKKISTAINKFCELFENISEYTQYKINTYLYYDYIENHKNYHIFDSRSSLLQKYFLKLLKYNNGETIPSDFTMMTGELRYVAMMINEIIDNKEKNNNPKKMFSPLYELIEKLIGIINTLNIRFNSHAYQIARVIYEWAHGKKPPIDSTGRWSEEDKIKKIIKPHSKLLQATSCYATRLAARHGKCIVWMASGKDNAPACAPACQDCSLD